jgi:hypothetical protein
MEKHIHNWIYTNKIETKIMNNKEYHFTKRFCPDCKKFKIIHLEEDLSDNLLN